MSVFLGNLQAFWMSKCFFLEFYFKYLLLTLGLIIEGDLILFRLKAI